MPTSSEKHHTPLVAESHSTPDAEEIRLQRLAFLQKNVPATASAGSASSSSSSSSQHANNLLPSSINGKMAFFSILSLSL